MQTLLLVPEQESITYALIGLRRRQPCNPGQNPDCHTDLPKKLGTNQFLC